MSNRDLYSKISAAASNVQFVEQVTEGDVYDNWNNSLTMLYGALNVAFVSQSVSNHVTTTRVVLYYGDRLLEGESNKIEIQDRGVDIVRSVLNGLQEVEIGEGMTFNFFEQKFADKLAGVWCEVDLITLDELGECNGYE